MKTSRLARAKYCLRICLCLIAAGLSTSTFTTRANDNNAALTVVTDIAPIHSLASMIMGETGTPHLIVSPNQSPHHFALKPSQVQLLSEADLIIYVDDEFTPPLSRQVTATNNSITRLELNSTLNNIESPSTNNDESHENNNDHDDHVHDHEDLHTWLNPAHAMAWLEHIAKVLSEKDPANAATYNRNAEVSIAQLTELNETLKLSLQSVGSAPYLVYHDAYQHFATAFNLAPAVSIAISDARKPGARRLSAMRKKVRSVACVFSEAQHSEALVNTVTVGLDVRRGILDPIGSNLVQGPTLYSQLLTQLAESFETCLSHE